MLTAKRQKLRSQEIEQIKVNILSNLPNLNKRQIRRHRIPYHEAIILELLEDGYTESAQFLTALIDYQDSVCTEDKEEALALNKPMLKANKEMIEIVYNGLKGAEDGIKTNQKIVEIDKLVELAIYFSQQHEDWWWLAEQLFMQCVNSVKDYHDDGDKKHAIIRYIFGRFLLKQMNDIERSKHNLRISRDLSNGQKWTAGEVLKIHQGILFKESCILLYEGLLKLTKEKLKSEPGQALKLCTMAHRRALDAEDYVAEAECLFYQALCEMELGLHQQAILKISKVLIMHFSTNNKNGICEARIQLAIAHNELDNMSEAKYHLHQLLDYTSKHNLKYYQARAHSLLGELYLMRSIGQEASNHLSNAIEIFNELDDNKNGEKAKNLAAVAKGLQLLRPLFRLINSCEINDPHYFQNVIKLVRWKDSRVSFWGEEDENDTSYLKRYLDIHGECDEPKFSKSSNAYVSEVTSDVVTSDVVTSDMVVSYSSEGNTSSLLTDVITLF